MAKKAKRSSHNKGRKIIRGTKDTLKQIRAAVDPRVVGGGVAGLTAGQVVGGAVGGVFGVVIAGPAGAVVGAEVGAFTAGVLGLKLGVDAVHDHLEKKRAGQASKPEASDPAVPSDPGKPSQKTSAGRFLQRKTSERVGEIVGLTSGASVGLIIAGPAGGVVGAVLGEALGGHMGEDMAKSRSTKGTPALKKPKESVSQWLDRFGKTTVGESASMLVAGSVGSVFGPGGRLVGQRVGLIFGKRIEWHKLGREREGGAEPATRPLLPETSSPVGADSSGPNRAAQTGSQDDGQDPSRPASMAAEPFSSVRPDPPVQLTERQLEVLRLLAVKLETKEIAERLDISPATVNYHKRNIYQKLGVNDQREAAYVAVELYPDLIDL